MGCRSFSTFRYCCVIIALVLHVPGGCYYQHVAAFTTSTSSSSSTAAATNGRARNQNHRYRGMYKNVHNKSNVFNKNDDEKEEKDHRKESSSSSSWKIQLKNAYDRRVNADPSFFSKSITEIIVAAGTQLMAELNRRGVSRIIPELDFVLPAIFAAIFGKYYRYVFKFVCLLAIRKY